MKAAILIACLGFVIATPSPPIAHKKTADEPQSESNPDKSQSKPPSPFPRNKIAAEKTTDHRGSRIEPGNNEYAVRIVSIPPRGTSGWIVLISTIVLALVGVAGVGVAIYTVRKIARQTAAIEAQTAATEKAAESTKANADAFISSERAWIMVETGQIPDNFEHDPNRLQVLEVRPVVINRGRTVGRITRGFIAKHTVAKNEKLPPEPDYTGKMSDVEVNLILAPTMLAQPLHVLIPLRDIESARLGVVTLYIYGFVDYTDLARIDRQTRFCFVYYLPGGYTVQPRGFYNAVDIPIAYTECT
jgi:hypothetical protein